MNRLVIIGNGFDLAHGLPTSYRDFIDDFWKNFKDKCKSDEYQNLISTHDHYNGYYNGVNQIENFNDLKVNLENYSKENGHFYDSNAVVCRNSHNTIFAFKSDFFKLINKKNSENWVDIENQYYKQLKIIAKHRSLSANEQKEQVVLLNKEFEQVKSLLKAYLIKTINKKYNWFDLKNNEIEDHLKEEPNIWEFLFDKKNKEYYENDVNLNLEDTLFLSFNYTKTIENYSSYMGNGFSCNYIHGELNNEELPIIFGFGDEMDEHYADIENLDDNEYLKNFKSIQYLEHSNYKNLYNFIEAEPFQVFIMGHSCGLSDRTLLSMIFENENCLSVKVYYYQMSKYSDNYTEIIQNISRHFKDKKMLRNKVVEKMHSKPLVKFIG
ncbi:AbiH family protein [Flavobacterium aquicola]|uniref:Abortive infection AbiH-like protein n=1 Tax=Flavobacterium aquicola TaxID=1682742 RepID=A0A3E0EN32_9FLAO|nr:AbiH family protein [Flavobacterium aquicola]REG99160.1 abortive infection AbiH-like protein [Flavobacterium aquicola]